MQAGEHGEGLGERDERDQPEAAANPQQPQQLDMAGA